MNVLEIRKKVMEKYIEEFMAQSYPYMDFSLMFNTPIPESVPVVQFFPSYAHKAMFDSWFNDRENKDLREAIAAWFEVNGSAVLATQIRADKVPWNETSKGDRVPYVFIPTALLCTLKTSYAREELERRRQCGTL